MRSEIRTYPGHDTDSHSATPSTARPAAGPGRRLARPMIGILATVVAALAGWAVLVELGGVTLQVDTGAGAATVVGAPAVAGASAVAALLGWATLALFERTVRTPRRWWTALAVTIAVISLVGPFEYATTAAAAGVLVLLHLLTAAVLVVSLAPGATPLREVSAA